MSESPAKVPLVSARNKHIASVISSEKSGDESDAVSNEFSKESVNPNFSKRTFKNKSGSIRSTQSSNWGYRETDLQEGSSSYHYASRLEYAELVRNTNDLDVEDDPDELLRKLDELKDQIVRTRDKSKEKEKVLMPIYANMHHTSHSLLPSLNQVQVFNDPFTSQNHRRASMTPFEQNPYHPYFFGQYVSSEITDNRLLHHPSCSCLVCYNKHRQTPPPVAPPVLQNDPMLYHHDYNRRFSTLSLNSHGAESHTRWSRDLRHPPRGILASGGKRCRPVAGGSPFVACCKCYELLQLPEKNTKKMRCAACSEVMLVSIVSKKLVLSVYSESHRDSEEPKNDPKVCEDPKWDDNEFESTDRFSVGEPCLTSYNSAVSYASEDGAKLSVREVENSVDVAINDKNPSPPPSGSPLQDHFDYSTKYNRAGKGHDMEQAAMGVNHRSSMKETVVASEIEISRLEYSMNTGSSEESRNSGGNESLFRGMMIKKGFGDMSRSSQQADQETMNVTVNGHPITERLVKKAEKLAGPIQPGEYWYDSRAGFWGVMGGPCLGIIPPFIEEFNHPMAENCADGNTGVFVNGRELHQMDMELLASRGLPTDEDRHYVIEISGRVVDVESGQELDGLGKLAPTVQRKKRGFGMKPPRTATV